MKNIYTREWLPPLILIIFSIVLEMINFLSLGFGVLPTYFMLDLAFILIYVGLLYLTPVGGKVWIVFASILLLIQIVLNILNDTIYSILGEIFNMSMLALSQEGISVFQWNFLDGGIVAINIAIFVLFIIISLYLYKTLPKSKLSKKLRFILVLSLFIGLQSIGISSFRLQTLTLNNSSTENGVISDAELWDNVFLKVEAFKRFGTFGFYTKNIGDYLFKPNTIKEDAKLNIDMAILEGRDYEISKSQYNGIAKDDNLIVLLLESFDSFAIDPINTPYIWSLISSDAVYMDNYHSKNKTNVSEAISIVGNSPYDRLLYDYAYKVGLDLPYSLPNVFQDIDSNAQVNFFHGYSKTFYRRDVVNPLLGFQNIYDVEDCTLEDKSTIYTDWILDSHYIDNMIDLFIPKDQHFFSYYTSITTHGPYDNDNYRLYDNIEYVKTHFNEYRDYINSQTDFVILTNEKDLNNLIQYKATCKDTDDMVRVIFERLESLNILDTTTVVMMGDHNCYFEDLCYKVKNIDTSDTENPKLYNVPLIIYNDQLQGGTNSTFCNSYDIYPTICDLFGIDYNYNLVQGYSIFSSDIENSVLVSFQNGMCTDKMFTYDMNNIIYYSDNVSEEEVTRFKENISLFYNKQELIEDIYTYNYFQYSHPALT